MVSVLRAGEMTLAATQAIEMLGKLADYIGLVELDLNPLQGRCSTWLPFFRVVIDMPIIGQTFTIDSKGLFWEEGKYLVTNDRPFPIEQFADRMADFVKAEFMQEAERRVLGLNNMLGLASRVYCTATSDSAN